MSKFLRYRVYTIAAVRSNNKQSDSKELSLSRGRSASQPSKFIKTNIVICLIFIDIIFF